MSIMIDEDYRVTFELNDKMKDEVVTKVLNFFKSHGAYAGEVIMQSDECLIDAPELLADLADNVFKFKVDTM